MADRNALSLADTGLAGLLSASKWTGIRVGDVISPTVPWAKANPVIAPQVLRLTSAVACCHVGFLTGCTESPSSTCRLGYVGLRGPPVSPFSAPSACARQGLENRLDLRIAWIVRVREQHADVIGLRGCCADHPLLVGVGHQRRLPGPRAHWLGAHAGESRPRDDRRRPGVLGAVSGIALKPRLDGRLTVGAGQGGPANYVVNRPGRYRQAVDRVVRVIRVMQVKRPRHLATLGRRDWFEPLPAGLSVRELRVVTARHQGEHPQDLASRLVAGEVDLARLGCDVRVLAGRRYLALHGGYARRPGWARPEQEHRGDDDDRGQAGRDEHDLAPARPSPPTGAAPSSVNERLGALPGRRSARRRVRPSGPRPGPDDRRQAIVLFRALVLDDVVKTRAGLRPAGRGLLRHSSFRRCLLRLGPQRSGTSILPPAGHPVPAVAGLGEFPGMSLTPVE